MKTIITSLFLLLGLSAFGQGTAIRSSSGFGTNTFLMTPTVRDGDVSAVVRLDIPPILPTVSGSLQFLLRVAGNSNLLSSSLFIIDTSTGALIGNGAGLTNLSGATNFSSSVTYNYNGKVTLNAVSYNTNLWAGPTNTLILSTNYQDYITTTDVNITNVGGQLAGQNTWATLTVSNASAGDITVRSTAAGLRAQGSATTAALVIGAGKEGVLSYLSRDFKSTNFVTTAQSN